MKYCNTCGEVYASRATICSADGGPLSEWTRTGNRRGKQEESQVTAVQTSADTSDDEHTNVDILRAIKATRVPRGKNHRSPRGTANFEIGEDTDIIDTNAHVTLTDFDAAAGTGTDVGKLVIYDDEVAGPFEGMLIDGRYRLESQLGTGAFGVVFDAFDQEDDRRVAVKLLSPALCDDKRALTRFRREAIAASRIQHPGIIRIYDFGIQDKGMSYIVMEYLAGRDLATLLEQEPYVPPRRAAGIIRQCALALAAAHDSGVLHRDLKPANIFAVQLDDQNEQIKILDFGIAKDRSSNPRNADLTSASKVVGTPYYMAPEQARGLALDGRADVYSLGVIFYELLTGKRPFEGASVYEILLAHTKAPRVAPSKARPDLTFDKDLERIVLKAIDSRVENRYSSMHEFATALHGYLDSSSPAAAGPSPHDELQTRAIPQATRPPGVGPVAGVRARTVSTRRRSLWWAAIPLVAAVAFLIYATSSTKSSADSKPKEQIAPELTIPVTTAAVPSATVPVTAADEAEAPPPCENVAPPPSEATAAAKPSKKESRRKRKARRSRSSKQRRSSSAKKSRPKSKSTEAIEQW